MSERAYSQPYAEERGRWQVRRTDDHGNVFTVCEGLSHAEATVICERLTRRGHKQTYDIREMGR